MAAIDGVLPELLTVSHVLMSLLSDLVINVIHFASKSTCFNVLAAAFFIIALRQKSPTSGETKYNRIRSPVGNSYVGLAS
jgi:hypothetical protein